MHVQVVSGAPLTALWAATYAWDLLNFVVPAAGMHTDCHHVELEATMYLLQTLHRWCMRTALPEVSDADAHGCEAQASVGPQAVGGADGRPLFIVFGVNHALETAETRFFCGMRRHHHLLLLL